MEFISNEHKAFYESHKGITEKGADYAALVYVLGLNKDCRKHFSDLYVPESGQIKPDALNKAWQTGASRKVTRLAFNLYTWDVPEDDNAEKLSPKELFTGIDDKTKKGMLLAIQYYA